MIQILREALENGYAFHMYSVVSVCRCTTIYLPFWMCEVLSQSTSILDRCAQLTIDVIEDQTEY